MTAAVDMAAAEGSSAEPQHEPVPIDAISEGNEVSVTTEQQTTPVRETGELLNRVATEISQAFQSSLVQVVSDIGREYGVSVGVEPGAKFAWMEKGGAAVALSDEQLPGKPEPDDGDNGDDVRRILRELELSRHQVRQLQQVVDDLRDEQRLSKQRVALFGTLSAKLKRDLVDERLALIDAKNEIKELRRKRSAESTSSGGKGGRSPRSSPLQEQCDNPWSSPNKPITGSAGGASGSGTSGGASGGSNLMAFNFYPSSRGADGQGGADDDDPSSPSSSTQTLRSTLMGQFLPSALLDSPQTTPKHARPFADDTLNEEKVPPPIFQIKDEMESLSLTAPPLPGSSPTSSKVKQQSTYDDAGDQTKETSQGDSGRMSTLSAVSFLQLSMLSELFDTIPAEELETILRRFDGQESAAIEHILSTHPSFNPAIGSKERGESGGSMASMSSPSRSSSAGQSKTSLHRSSSQSGSNGPPAGSSSNWKTEICMYYMQGKCNKTRRTCSFAHGESDLVRSSGSNSGGSISKHGPSYKTRLCQAYESGTCTKSRRDCPMAHGVNDLRDGGITSGISGGSQPSATPRLQSYKTELCYYFLKGNCNYSKEECRFAHGQNDLRTVESNTAQIAAAASSSRDFSPSSPVPPPPAVSMAKQLQLQHQYQQQYQHHQPSSMASFQPQPPPVQPQNFVPQHQIQLQRGVGGTGQHQFGFQHQQYDLAQQQQQYMPSASQYRYLKNIEDKRLTSVGRPSQRDSGPSWSNFDATGLPPSEY